MKTALLLGAAILMGGAAWWGMTAMGSGVPLSASAQSRVQPLPSSPIRRCMNMGGALEAPNEGEWGYTIRQRDFATLKATGFDTIRLPVKWSAHAETRPPYRIDRNFLRRIDEIVDWATLAGLQIIIDVHHYDELMTNPDAHEPRLEAIWDQLAHHYHKAPPSVMFELINEPNDQMTVQRTDQLNARLMSRIRQDNPDRWVVVGSAGWGAYDALMKARLPRDPRIISTFHFYGPMEVTHQGATWTASDYPVGVGWGSDREYKDIRKQMRQIADWGRSQQYPLFLGEFGVIDKASPETRTRWAEAVRIAAEAENISWCYWDFATAFKAYDMSREQWLPGMKQALTRY